MVTPCRILADGRIAIAITISTRNSVSAVVELALDTGSSYTLIPMATFIDLYTRDPQAQIRAGRTIKIPNFGFNILEAHGLSLATTVYDHGGHNPVTRHYAGVMELHAVPNPQAYFDGTVGLLGMKTLDALQADVVKDISGTVAYLAKRV